MYPPLSQRRQEAQLIPLYKIINGLAQVPFVGVLIETGCKSRYRHKCTKFGLMELVNIILLRDVSVNGMVSIGMKMDRKVWKKYICERIQEVGRQSWKNGFNDTEREKEYVEMKRCPRNESFADGSVGARVRLMMRGG